MAKAYVSGLGCVEKQTKTVDLTEAVDILPDSGKLLEKVIIKTDSIEATLGEIIATQRSLLPRPTFTIDGTKYEFEEGMTWDEYAASEYNTTGVMISYFVYFGSTSYAICDEAGNWLTGDMGIIVGGKYVTVPNV